jgi:hypothetical protein
MKLHGYWHPANGLRIPGTWFADPTALDGERFEATDYGWSLIRDLVRKRAEHRCQACGRHCRVGHTHHLYGRGMGSSKREDRWEVEDPATGLKVRFLEFLCSQCHSNAVILAWGNWRAAATAKSQISA